MVCKRILASNTILINPLYVVLKISSFLSLVHSLFLNTQNLISEKFYMALNKKTFFVIRNLAAIPLLLRRLLYFTVSDVLVTDGKV